MHLRHLAIPAALLLARSAQAAEWTWELPASVTPTSVTICPLKYDKTFAYALEIDDSPVCMYTAAQPLLAKLFYTDAPPGVPGGKALPFVGTAGLIGSNLNTRNNTVINHDQLQELLAAGWGISNHSYAHRGKTYEPKEILSPEEMRTDLFWSQVVLAAENPTGRAPMSFIFPNGYIHYKDHLAEFGILIGTRVAGSASPNLNAPKFNLPDFNRNYLDEGVWAKSGKGDPHWNSPVGKPPAAGDFIIDFTHGINADAGTPNHQRWAARLEGIEKQFGQPGSDSVWVAPTGTVAAYIVAAKQAKAELRGRTLVVSLPDTSPGTALTLRLAGITADVSAPAGASVYRKDDTLWITTPPLGTPGANLPTPKVVRQYSGPLKELTFDKPVRIAAVRVLQGSPVGEGYRMKVDAITASGSINLVPPEKAELPKAWGTWRLIDVLPTRPAVEATALQVAATKGLDQMEVWIVP